MSAFKITGRMVSFSRLILETNNQDKIREQLTDLNKKTPLLNIPIVIDSIVEQELIDIIQLFLSEGLQPIAVIDGLLTQQAKNIQFPILPKDRAIERIRATNEQTSQPPNAHTTEENTSSHADEQTATINSQCENNDPIQKIIIEHKTSFHQTMLRTGQCLIQEYGDIILTAGTNSGSEVIASGNIHVYGFARGRLIAGASGDIHAKIFCHALNSELISIAGIYCLADDIPSYVIGKPCYVYLDEEQELKFERLEL